MSDKNQKSSLNNDDWNALDKCWGDRYAEEYAPKDFVLR